MHLIRRSVVASSGVLLIIGMTNAISGRVSRARICLSFVATRLVSDIPRLANFEVNFSLCNMWLVEAKFYIVSRNIN